MKDCQSMDKKKKKNETKIQLPTNSDTQARAWSQSAANYDDEFLDPFRDHVDNPLLKMILEIETEKAKEMKVADLGCGTGAMLPLLAPRGWRDAMRRIGSLRDGQIRFVGLVALLGGALLLSAAGGA